ncbi:MAG: polysaccharide biosynthesis C-terminal domain-containing protein, partial [Cyanobacteria bacterium J06649_4]
LISAMYVVENRTDTLMLGTLEGTASVGLYAVANKGAEAISYMLLAVNTAMASKFAKLYAQGDRQKLQKEVTKCTRIITSVAFPIGLGLIIFGTWFLQLFGSDFVAARGALTVLCVSNLVNALVGSVSLLLIMSGHARYVSTTVTVTAGVNILLNFVLIPRFGVVGAAIATATSTILRNIVLERFVRQKIGIHTSVFIGP